MRARLGSRAASVATFGALALAGCGRLKFSSVADASATSGDVAFDADTRVEPVCTATWCWLNPPPVGQRSLRAISGTSATDIWAVGDAGTVEHYDGTSWMIVPVPLNDAFTAVFANTPTDVWIGARAGAMLHWNGSTWTQSTTPSGSTVAAFALAPPGGGGQLWEVGELGTASHDAIAVVGAPGAYTATAVLVNSPSDVWATLQFNIAAHFTGAGWDEITIAEFPTAITPGTAAGTYWIGGGSISTFDGTTLTNVITGANIRGMWATTVDDEWAVGDAGAAWHYNGTSWLTAPTAPTALQLNAVWASSATDVWAVGENGVIAHYNGQSIDISSAPASTPFWNAVLAIDDTHLWLGRNDTAIYQYDGTTLTPYAVPMAVQIEELEMRATDDVWAIDQAGTNLLHWDGTAWSVDTSFGLVQPSSLAANANEVVAGGQVGSVIGKTTGAWSQIYDAPGNQWTGLCEDASGDAIVVGRFGSTSVRTGTAGTWGVASTPTDRFLQACTFAGTDAWAVGGDATIHFAGGAWTADNTTATTRSLTDIASRSGTELFVVANAGALEWFDGQHWHEEASPTGADLRKLTVSPNGTVYAVGYEGAILRRQ